MPTQETLLKNKTWRLTKSEFFTVRNDVLDTFTIDTAPNRQIFRFLDDSIVEYEEVNIVAPIPYLGQWWLSKVTGNITIRFPDDAMNMTMNNARIIELTDKKLVVNVPGLTGYVPAKDEKIFYYKIQHYSPE